MIFRVNPVKPNQALLCKVYLIVMYKTFFRTLREQLYTRVFLLEVLFKTIKIFDKHLS